MDLGEEGRHIYSPASPLQGPSAPAPLPRAALVPRGERLSRSPVSPSSARSGGEAVARRAMEIAAGICVYTNENVIVESL